jgi:hypothetical protein
LLCRTVSYCTVNKPLVPEWPCIIEVSYIYPPTVIPFFERRNLKENNINKRFR